MTEEHSSREKSPCLLIRETDLIKHTKLDPQEPDWAIVAQLWSNFGWVHLALLLRVHLRSQKKKNNSSPKYLFIIVWHMCLYLQCIFCFLSPHSPPFSIEQVSSQQSRQKPYFIYTNKVLLALSDKGSWIFHVLSLLDSLCPPGYWPAGRQWAQEKSSRLLECSSMKLIITCWLRSPWHVWKH